jgi:RuvA, C-terminal domain
MTLFFSGLLTGALLISGCVVATKGSLAGMFLLGAILGASLLAGVQVYLRRVFGRRSKTIGGHAKLFDNRIALASRGGSNGSPHNSQRAHAQKPVSVTLAGSANPKRTRRNPLQSDEHMLPVVQQEVLSALMNLGMSFKHAEQAVREAASQKSGESFDELFRLAVGMGKAKKVAA